MGREDGPVPGSVTQRAEQQLLLVIAPLVVYVGVVVGKKDIMEMDQSSGRKCGKHLIGQE